MTRQSSTITSGEPPGAIVAAIVLQRRGGSQDIDPGDEFLSLICSQAVNNEDDPDVGDCIRVSGIDLSLHEIRHAGWGAELEDSSSCWTTTTSSSRCCELILSWLRDCRQACPIRCSENWSATLRNTISGVSSIDPGCSDIQLPTRLVDLAAFSDGSALRLVESRALTDIEYLTLSYTWGGIKPLMLERANYRDFVNRIELDRLPKVCQQAVAMTRKLGFRYLWIDALCIVQDDKDDWLRESARMDSVFAGSTMTLAAASTENCQQDLCLTRDPLKTFPMSLQTLGLRYMLVPATCSSHARPPPPLRHFFGKGLDTRGWVFQERALSPRTVHFTGTRIHWECRSRWRCESLDVDCRLSGKSSPKNLLAELQRYKASYSSSFGLLKGAQAMEHAHGIWANMCSRYGSTALTNWSDRSLALAGLLRFLQANSKLHVVHGICFEFRLRDLLWYTLYPGHSERVNGVPTWSWMCLKAVRRFYKLSMSNLLLPRQEIADRPQSFTSQRGDRLTETATGVMATDQSKLHLNIPLIHISRLLEGGIKRSATRWEIKHDTYPDIEIHIFTEAGFNISHELSRTSMLETWCGVLFEGASNVCSKVRYCVLLNPVHGFSNQFTRVGVAEVEYRSSIHADWQMQDIEVV